MCGVCVCVCIGIFIMCCWISRCPTISINNFDWMFGCDLGRFLLLGRQLVLSYSLEKKLAVP